MRCPRKRDQSLISADPLLASPIFKNRKWGRNNSVLGMKDCFQTNAPSPPPNSPLLEFGGGREGVTSPPQLLSLLPSTHIIHTPAGQSRLRGCWYPTPSRHAWRVRIFFQKKFDNYIHLCYYYFNPFSGGGSPGGASVKGSRKRLFYFWG